MQPGRLAVYRTAVSSLGGAGAERTHSDPGKVMHLAQNTQGHLATVGPSSAATPESQVRTYGSHLSLSLQGTFGKWGKQKAGYLGMGAEPLVLFMRDLSCHLREEGMMR